MLRETDEKALFERFSNKYKLVQNELLRQIERSNCVDAITVPPALPRSNRPGN